MPDHVTVGEHCQGMPLAAVVAETQIEGDVGDEPLLIEGTRIAATARQLSASISARETSWQVGTIG
jgi:hypothetical protein